MERVFSINVRLRNGYSFAVNVNTDNAADAIQMAENAGLFQDEGDAFFAMAEDITESEYDLHGLKDVTYDLTKKNNL